MYSLHRYLSLMHTFSITYANIAISHIFLKLDSLGHIFVGDIICLSSTTLMKFPPHSYRIQ